MADDDYEGPSGHYEDFGLAVVVVALAFGVVARTVCGKSVKVGVVKNVADAFSLLPYTVWLLLFGVFLGCINLAYPGNLMHSSIEAWTNVDAHVLLFVFLPVLLFQSSFSVDPHIMRHEALQIFCLAVPGVVFSAVAIGVFSKYLIPTFSWNIALFFGSMMSATDPVAVVALLKEMGVDERLGTLIEGEALMNDGSAYVMFVIFGRAIMYEYCCDVGQVFAWAARLAIGGPILGLCFGVVVVWMLDGFIKNDMAAQITLTLVAAFSCFLAAEGTDLKVSGVLAVVFCGLYLSEWAVFEEKNEHSLKSFWNEAEYIADTVIFVVSGLIVSSVVWQGEIGGWDWLFLFLLYVLLQIIRFLIVLMAWPVLKSKSGYGKSWDYREMAVLSFCGLRGTVGLSLALIGEDLLRARGKKDDEKNAGLIVFSMSGIVFLSLVLNGSLMNPLIHFVGLDRVTHAEEDLFLHSVSRVEALLQNYVDDILKTDLFLGDAAFQQVWRYVPVFSCAQYWHRIDSGKIHLGPFELEDAIASGLVGRRGNSQEQRHCCPPSLQGTWNRYHQKFGQMPRPGDGTLRFRRVPTAPNSTADNARTLEHRAIDLQKQLAGAHKQLRAYRSQVTHVRAPMGLPEGSEDPATIEENLVQGRTRFMTALRAKYVANHHIGRLLPRTLRYLRESADVALDYPEKSLHDWEYLEHRLDSSSMRFYLNLLQRLRSCSCVGGILRNLVRNRVFNQMSLIQEIASEFVYAREEVDVFELLESEEAAKTISQENEVQLRRVLHVMHRNMDWPDISNALKTRTASRQLLMHHKRIVDELLENGALTEREFEIFEGITESMLRKVQRHPVCEETRSIKTVLKYGVPGPNMAKKLAIMEGVSNEDIKTFLAADVMFREDFVRPHVTLFQEGDTAVFGSSDDHSTFRGRHGWFILVRGMVKVKSGYGEDVNSVASTTGESSIDESEGRTSVLEPGAMIGMIEQLLGTPMTSTYQTSSYCHLIFVDTVEYLKEASPFKNVSLYQALFRAMGKEVLPGLLGIPFSNASFAEASCIAIADETVDVVTSDPIGDGSTSETGNGLKQAVRSKSFCDLAELEPGFELHPMERSIAARLMAVKRPKEKASVHQYVAVLDKTRWYMLLRGSILGRSADIEEKERAHNAIQRVRHLAERSASEPLFSLETCELEQFDNILQKLLVQQSGPGAIHLQTAPCMVRKVHGRVRVSARTVILELPDDFKAVQAAHKWLSKVQDQMKSEFYDLRAIFDEIGSPRTSTKRIFSTEETVQEQPHGGQSLYGLSDEEEEAFAERPSFG